jgi:2',3'-cyclic-nucleotide 2'-phosphodiesterase (5'-nucleotidase family)
MSFRRQQVSKLTQSLLFEMTFINQLGIQVGDLTKGKHMIPILNQMGIGAACIGNHDFG